MILNYDVQNRGENNNERENNNMCMFYTLRTQISWYLRRIIQFKSIGICNIIFKQRYMVYFYENTRFMFLRHCNNDPD